MLLLVVGHIGPLRGLGVGHDSASGVASVDLACTTRVRVVIFLAQASVLLDPRKGVILENVFIGYS